MNKNLTAGGAQIPYGPALPDPTTAFDGQLFYLTSGASQGLYVFGFNQDVNSASPGDQVAQQWNIVTSPGLYVAKSGDTMTGPLTAPNFIGPLQGNAATATFATTAGSATTATTATNATQLNGGALVGPARPASLFNNQTDFWAQGVNFGVTFTH